MRLEVTEGAPHNLQYPYTDRLEPGDTFEVSEEKAEALLERHDYLIESDEVVLDDDEYTELCGTEMSDGSECDRPVDDCPYH